MDTDKLIIDNHNMIYHFAIKYRLDIDEWYGVIATGLIKAARKFDATLGYTFSSFAYKIMRNEVLREKIKQDRDCLTHALTLDGYEDDTPLVEIIAGEEEPKYDIKLPKELTEEEKEILVYKACGFSNKEIASFMGIRKERVSRKMGTIRCKWQEAKDNAEFD